MTINPTHKSKIVFMTGVVILALVGFGIFTNTVFAAAQDIVTSGAKAANSFTSSAVNVAGYTVAIYVFLNVLQSVLVALLGWAGFFLDQLFHYNVVLNPASMPVVYEGWKIIRDIANAFFILVVLWVAFTIIFNVENLGGRKLLIRIIVIALLINFSLTLVTGVFAIANLLAKPFKEALGNPDVAGLILDKTKLHTVTEQLTAANQTILENQGKQQQALEDQSRFSDTQGLGAGYTEIKPNIANAEGPTTFAGCGFGALLGSFIPVPGVAQGAGCIAGAIIFSIAGALASWGVALGTIALAWKAILNLAVANIFLLITLFAFVTAGIVLLGRIIAMVFLGVLAPAAFLLHVVPGGGKKFWDMWVENLLKWAFFAPAFYFLFYMSFLVLDQMSTTIPKDVGQFQANFPAILTLVVFLGFLFASISIARRMGITVADSFVKWGQKTGWGALSTAGGFVGGLASRTILPGVGRV